MCLAVPMKIESVVGAEGVVAFAGSRYHVRLDFIEDPAPGDYVMVHTGIAVGKVDPAAAEQTLAFLEEVHEAAD